MHVLALCKAARLQPRALYAANQQLSGRGPDGPHHVRGMRLRGQMAPRDPARHGRGGRSREGREGHDILWKIPQIQLCFEMDFGAFSAAAVPGGALLTINLFLSFPLERRTAPHIGVISLP